MNREPDYLCYEEFDQFDDDDIEDVDCHLMPDGQCMLAGTEYCDWECGRLG